METNIGGYHRVRWARGVLIPSPCVTDFRTLILWSQDLVPSFVRFSDIPFPYGINILVATLFIFRERATLLSPSITTSISITTPPSSSPSSISHHLHQSSPPPSSSTRNTSQV